MMRLIIGTCKEATAMQEKAEEGKLSLFQNLRYRLHLAVCGICSTFAENDSLLKEHLRKHKTKPHFSEKQKKALKEKLLQE